jgi:beta-1,2-mannobiose phosphorylase / 1,2-beta-oligomannan phosphorylase
MTSVDELARFEGTITRLGVVLSPDGSAAEVEGVLNPGGAAARDGRWLLYPRAVARGNVSRVELCEGLRSGDGIRFERRGFALEPHAAYEMRTAPGGMGCEDPRVTFVPVLDRYVMAYTAFGPDGPRIAVALSQDGLRWERLGLVRFAPGLHQGDDKDGVFFPEPVLSPGNVRSLAFYHRPMLRLSLLNGRAAVPTLLDLPPHERESTRIAYVPLEPVLADVRALLDVRESAVVLEPDAPWCRIKTGAGTPPVRIAEGWFSIFHGVDAREVAENKYAMCYSAGFVVHDAQRPHVVRYRSQTAVMTPEGVDETHGIVNNVVFPTALCELGERSYEIYYGMADARIGRARLQLAPPETAAEEPAA